MKKILILNGPNLNMLGRREPSIYGNKNFLDYYNQDLFGTCDCELSTYQSNNEGDLVTTIQNSEGIYDGIVLNAGAYTHTSIAIRDAITSINVPVVEVHISNVFAREEFRHHSYISPVCKGTIVGLGLYGYKAAIDWLISH